MKSFGKSCLALLAAAVCAGPAVADSSCHAKSPNGTVALLELYTSEGCDSCPPADRWLGTLRAAGIGPARVVPLAFHVDYWNDLGWPDRFAQSAFTARQRDFVRRTNATTAYTPEVLLNGREYRHWSAGTLTDDLSRIAAAPARADIGLTLTRQGKALRIDADAGTQSPGTPAELYIAIYENDLNSQVTAGENRGRRLHHEFVVRRLLGPVAFDARGKVHFRQTLTLGADWKPADLGVAAFVQKSGGTEILQALALTACPEK
ncbi:MAG: DUF1223 domain-containing protein [Sulfurifustis sp.]